MSVPNKFNGFDPRKFPLRRLIQARKKFSRVEWDEGIGIKKPDGFDEMPMISQGRSRKRKRTKWDETHEVVNMLDYLIEERKTLLIEQRLEELDDLRFMNNNGQKEISQSDQSCD